MGKKNQPITGEPKGPRGFTKVQWKTALLTGSYAVRKYPHRSFLSTLQLCRVLLEHGCTVNYLSRTGESPLHIMTKKGRFEAAMVLLTHGANANLKDQGGNTALHLAMKVCMLRYCFRHSSQQIKCFVVRCKQNANLEISAGVGKVFLSSRWKVEYQAIP